MHEQEDQRAPTTMRLYVLVNTFTPKPGLIDAFLALQLAEMQRLGEAAQRTGWCGNEVYRAHDGASVIIVTRFETREAQQAWAQRSEFARHRERIGPLLETVHSVPCDLVAVNRPAQARSHQAPSGL